LHLWEFGKALDIQILIPPLDVQLYERLEQRSSVRDSGNIQRDSRIIRRDSGNIRRDSGNIRGDSGNMIAPLGVREVF
jgi:hypothetical protein